MLMLLNVMSVNWKQIQFYAYNVSIKVITLGIIIKKFKWLEDVVIVVMMRNGVVLVHVLIIVIKIWRLK